MAKVGRPKGSRSNKELSALKKELSEVTQRNEILERNVKELKDLVRELELIIGKFTGGKMRSGIYATSTCENSYQKIIEFWETHPGI